jgi:hypothetical protein
MTRHKTLSELMWPDTSTEMAVDWAAGVSSRVIDWTWRAFDELRKELAVRKIDWDVPIEQLERSLVQLHFLEIQEIYLTETDGLATIVPIHEWDEFESRSRASAKPRSCDFGFCAGKALNRRWFWPIEAKVIYTSNSLADYLKDVKGKFVGGKVAPFVGEGGMVAYFVGTDSDSFFSGLERQLKARLEFVKGFREDSHRVSRHKRRGRPPIRLHHMRMLCRDGDDEVSDPMDA